MRGLLFYSALSALTLVSLAAVPAIGQHQQLLACEGIDWGIFVSDARNLWRS